MGWECSRRRGVGGVRRVVWHVWQNKFVEEEKRKGFGAGFMIASRCYTNQQYHQYRISSSLGSVFNSRTIHLDIPSYSSWGTDQNSQIGITMLYHLVTELRENISYCDMYFYGEMISG